MEAASSGFEFLDIEGYQVLEPIGAGGMCSVYRAIQTSLGRPVAIKILSRELAGDSSILERFARESVIIARLDHPGIVRVIDRGVASDGRPFFAMEHVRGSDLASLIAAGGLEISQKLDVVVQICKALSYAHRNGVIHRDIKPANVILDDQGQVRILDFGIAKLAGTEAYDQTASNLVVGTLAYMSPEQLSGAQKLTTRTDLYALGVLMYEMFTGRKPTGRFPAASALDRRLPPELDAIIDRCLQADPADRFASAEEVKDLVLALMPGAHLGTVQRERTQKEMGAVAGKFTLLDVIKRGQHSSVYLYLDNRDQQLLAIKKVASARDGLAEAKALARLDHPNLVKVLGVSGSRTSFIVVMEYLSGGSLEERMTRRFRPSEAMRVTRDVLAGLAHAHSHGLVHGNIRPSNILFSSASGVRVSDFGSADLSIGFGSAGTGSTGHDSGNPRVDGYNPWKRPPTPLADLEAAGCVLYRMVSGRLPEWKDRALVRCPEFDTVPPPVQGLALRLMGAGTARRFTRCADAIDAFDRTPIDWEEEDQTSEKTEHFVETGGPRDGRRARQAAWLPRLLLVSVLLLAAWLYLTASGHGDFWLEWIGSLGR